MLDQLLGTSQLHRSLLNATLADNVLSQRIVRRNLASSAVCLNGKRRRIQDCSDVVPFNQAVVEVNFDANSS